MPVCTKCGKDVNCTIDDICRDCYEAQKTERLNAIKNSITKTSDWQAYDKEDMSEIFWRELAAYLKYPNKKSLSLIHSCQMWAHHDDHGLANSFHNALKWAKLDLYKEYCRKDLPED